MSKQWIHIIWIICLVLGFHHSKAQENHALGIRVSVAGGLSYKLMLDEQYGGEFIVSVRDGGILLSPLAEIHHPFQEGSPWNVYYGGGPHFYIDATNNFGGAHSSVLGLSAIGGIEYNLYKIKEIPFQFSLDWKPTYNFINHHNIWLDDVALSIRFIL